MTSLGYKVYAQIENMLTGVRTVREVGDGAAYEDVWNQAHIVFEQGRNGWYEHNNRLRILRIEIVKVLNVASFKKMEWKIDGNPEGDKE